MVPPENWLHNIEHGGVAFLWACPDGCASERAELEAWVATLPVGRALVTVYPEMEGQWRFAAVAWQNRLLLNCLDLDAMKTFFADRVAQAPENIINPPPPSCEDTGGSRI